MKVKRPLFNHTSESCIVCKDRYQGSYEVEYSPDWFSYMCVTCMSEYARKWGIEFETERDDH